MPNSTGIYEGFSVSHAAILNGTTLDDALNGDIYGVRSGALALQTSSFDNTGDDAVLSSWHWFTKATLTISSGFVPFLTLALISGIKVTSSTSTDGSDIMSLPLWEERMQNIAPQPVLLRVPAKDSNGALRTLDFVLYRVQFAPFSFTGPTYKTGLQLDYSGDALISPTDEAGNQVKDSVTGANSKSIGRLISTD